MFTPIKSRGLVDEVCGRIEQAVETGLLTSGQRLPNETELAAALGVSAVTAREALSSCGPLASSARSGAATGEASSRTTSCPPGNARWTNCGK